MKVNEIELDEYSSLMLFVHTENGKVKLEYWYSEYDGWCVAATCYNREGKEYFHFHSGECEFSKQGALEIEKFALEFTGRDSE